MLNTTLEKKEEEEYFSRILVINNLNKHTQYLERYLKKPPPSVHPSLCKKKKYIHLVKTLRQNLLNLNTAQIHIHVAQK